MKSSTYMKLNNAAVDLRHLMYVRMYPSHIPILKSHMIAWSHWNFHYRIARTLIAISSRIDNER